MRKYVLLFFALFLIFGCSLNGRSAIPNYTNKFGKAVGSTVLLAGIIADEKAGHGTAVAIGWKDGLTQFLTAGHVCSMIQRLEMVGGYGLLEDYQGENALATIVDIEFNNQITLGTDYCLVEAELDVPLAPLKNPNTIYGAEVYTIGAPYGMYPAPSSGHIMSAMKKRLLVSLNVGQGSSGAGIWQNGYVVGIITEAYAEGQFPGEGHVSHFGYAIPIGDIKAFLVANKISWIGTI